MTVRITLGWFKTKKLNVSELCNQSSRPQSNCEAVQSLENCRSPIVSIQNTKKLWQVKWAKNIRIQMLLFFVFTCLINLSVTIKIFPNFKC